jgi:hypothetical protein
VFAYAGLSSACDDASAPEPAADAPPLRARLTVVAGRVALRAEEEVLRGTFDWRDPPRGALELGSDPVAIHLEPSATRAWIAERRGRGGRPELVRLDAAAGPDPRLVEGARVAALDGSLSERATLSGMAARGPTLFVAARGVAHLAAFDAATLTRRPERDVRLGEHADVVALVAEGECLHALDLGRPSRRAAATGAELRSFCGAEEKATSVATGAHALAADGALVAVASALDHTIELFDRAGGDSWRVVHDAPVFSVDVEADAGWIVAGGLEDRPLDRSEGFFGHVDSTLFLYARERGALTRRAELNLSELGILTPKVVRFVAADRVWVFGYGSGRAAEIAVSEDGLFLLEVFDSVPGIVDGSLETPPEEGGRFVGVSDLFDAAVLVGPGTRPTPWTRGPDPGARERSPEERQLRLGEALLFTELLAPSQISEGAHSRFTCEACHFRGGIDGRRHHTGRGDTHATTKPLSGLATNTPLFTRALDPDVATMVFAEFEVASRGTGHTGWTELREVDLPWLDLADLGDDRSPLAQRAALARYLGERPFEPNREALREGAWTEEVELGAELFAQRCEGCHAARLVASDAATRVPRSEWRASITSPAGPIVWARDGYERTGIEPYVHERGARPSSLRRIAWKTPYFTDGSARSLDEVVLSFGQAPETASGEALHRGGPRVFEEEEVTALVAFLHLL